MGFHRELPHGIPQGNLSTEIITGVSSGDSASNSIWKFRQELLLRILHEFLLGNSRKFLLGCPPEVSSKSSLGRFLQKLILEIDPEVLHRACSRSLPLVFLPVFHEGIPSGFSFWECFQKDFLWIFLGDCFHMEFVLQILPGVPLGGYTRNNCLGFLEAFPLGITRLSSGDFSRRNPLNYHQEELLE